MTDNVTVVKYQPGNTTFDLKCITQDKSYWRDGMCMPDIALTHACTWFCLISFCKTFFAAFAKSLQKQAGRKKRGRS